MRKIPYTDIEICSDPRMLVIRNILPSVIIQSDIEQSIVVLLPDNQLMVICQLTTIFSCNLNECIPDYAMYIDPKSFLEEYIEEYKLQPDEYVVFNKDKNDLYFNIDTVINQYFYNVNSYTLIDKIEDITSYDSFESYNNLKADNGSRFFRGFNNKFVIPIFNKFPNIAKSDKADLYVYRFDNESDLVIWKVRKKKINRDFYTIFRVLKLI